VLFRFILYLSAAFMTAFLAVGWAILALFFWLTVLILGRTPRPVFDATAAVVRYTMRAQAYVVMLTSAYPKGLFGDRALVLAVPALGDTRHSRRTRTGGRFPARTPGSPRNALVRRRCRRAAAVPARSCSPPAAGYC
jgi:Domain of unknown function (DUF4389)